MNVAIRKLLRFHLTYQRLSYCNSVRTLNYQEARPNLRIITRFRPKVTMSTATANTRQTMRELVLKQLESMGVSDISDSMIDEFLKELEDDGFLGELDLNDAGVVGQSHVEVGQNDVRSKSERKNFISLRQNDVDVGETQSEAETEVTETGGIAGIPGIPITRDDVREQLAEMGIEGAVSEELIDEFMAELERTYLRDNNQWNELNESVTTTRTTGGMVGDVNDNDGHFGYTDSYINPTSSMSMSMSMNSTARYVPHESPIKHVKQTLHSTSRPTSPTRAPTQVSPKVEARASMSVIERLANLDLSKTREKVMEQKMRSGVTSTFGNTASRWEETEEEDSLYYEPESYASSRLPQKPKARRKTDPVSLYHRYNQDWSQNKFLKRVEASKIPGWTGYSGYTIKGAGKTKTGDRVVVKTKTT